MVDAGGRFPGLWPFLSLCCGDELSSYEAVVLGEAVRRLGQWPPRGVFGVVVGRLGQRPPWGVVVVAAEALAVPVDEAGQVVEAEEGGEGGEGCIGLALEVLEGQEELAVAGNRVDDGSHGMDRPVELPQFYLKPPLQRVPEPRHGRRPRVDGVSGEHEESGALVALREGRGGLDAHIVAVDGVVPRPAPAPGEGVLAPGLCHAGDRPRHGLDGVMSRTLQSERVEARRVARTRPPGAAPDAGHRPRRRRPVDLHGREV
mmetsp:Transcript_30708/g.98968  ORF Transcript_30708/g.98968 Transcript_30708/m.98968 type:complete len:259 (-) Transcript_30708:21-797(-)